MSLQRWSQILWRQLWGANAEALIRLRHRKEEYYISPGDVLLRIKFDCCGGKSNWLENETKMSMITLFSHIFFWNNRVCMQLSHQHPCSFAHAQLFRTLVGHSVSRKHTKWHCKSPRKCWIFCRIQTSSDQGPYLCRYSSWGTRQPNHWICCCRCQWWLILASIHSGPGQPVLSACRNAYWREEWRRPSNKDEWPSPHGWLDPRWKVSENELQNWWTRKVEKWNEERWNKDWKAKSKVKLQKLQPIQRAS